MIVWDNHTCMPLRPDDDSFLPQLRRFRDAGVDVVSINIGFGEQGPAEHLRLLAHFRHWIAQHPDAYQLVSNVDDIARARSQGKLAVFFDIEGANAIADQLSLISMYYDLGVRWMSIAYNRNNRAGGGCMDEDGGLTEFGRAFIDEMERVGMLVCCSHTGERTVRDVLAYARRPVIFSHSNPRALWDHARNVADDVLVQCARGGGVIGINGVGLFLGPNDVSSATIARNVDYVARLCGIDHVGIGLDYVFDDQELMDYLKHYPQLFNTPDGPVKAEACDFAAPEQFPEIAASLRALGYADSDVAKVMGENWMRLARECWR